MGTKTVGAAAKVHVLLAFVAFGCVLVGTILASRVLRREPGWEPIATVLYLFARLSLVPILLLGRAHLSLHSLGGLWEKTFLGMELAWLLIVAVWIARDADARVTSTALAG